MLFKYIWNILIQTRLYDRSQTNGFLKIEIILDVNVKQ